VVVWNVQTLQGNVAS